MGRSSFVGMAGNPLSTLLFASSILRTVLIRRGKRWTLKWKVNPMPTMLTDEMKAMPQSVQPTPAAPPRKPPAKRTYQEDEINAFLSQDIIGDFSELNSTHAPPAFQCTKSDNSIVFFNLTYVDGFPVIFESIKVDQSLHIQLQFNGHPVPLPAWFTKGRNATLTRFSQLNNFPNAIRVVSEETECSRSLLNEMLDISNYQAKGRHLQNWLSILAIVLRSWITHTTSFKHTGSGMCGQHILKFLIGFLPRLTFVVQNITIGD